MIGGEVSHEAWRRSAKFFWTLFLVDGWLAGASAAVTLYAGVDVGRLNNLVSVALLPALLLAAVWCYERAGGVAARPWRGYLFLFGVVWVGLCFYGLLAGNALRVLLLDTLTFGMVMAAFFAGRRQEVWEDSKGPVMLLTGLSIALALWNTDSYVLVDRGILNDELGSGFEMGLILAPLYCLATVSDRETWKYYVLLFLSLGCLFTYFYFGRRGISTRCAIEVLCAAVVLPVLLGKKRRALVASAVALAFAATLWLLFPFDTLVRRFEGRGGIIETLTIDNGRLLESSMLLEEFSEFEMLIGRGAGGAFLINEPNSFALDRIDDERAGRIVLHAGAWLPFLKGGVLLQALYFFPLLALLAAGRRWRTLDPITKATLMSGFVMLGFQFIEGSPTYSTPWVAVWIGLTMSRAQNTGDGRRRDRARHGAPLRPLAA